MDSRQEAKLSMYIKVQQFLDEKLAVLTALFSIITDYKTDLDDFITDIFAADANATADTTGYTEAKQAKRDEMTLLALRIGGAGAAYYKSIDDSGSQNEIFFEKSEMVRAADTVVYTQTMQVYRLANLAGAALAPHGVTVADIANLNLLAQQYLALLELPKRKVSAKSAQGKKVDAVMKETDDFLNETLDSQMRVLQGTDNQELYDEYLGNRGIDDNPGGGGGDGGGGGGSVVYEEFTVPGGSVISIGDAPPDSTQIEIIHAGGLGDAQFCTSSDVVSPCATNTYTISPTETYLGTFGGMSISGGAIVKVTNTGVDDLLIRFRVVV